MVIKNKTITVISGLLVSASLYAGPANPLRFAVGRTLFRTAVPTSLPRITVACLGLKAAEHSKGMAKQSDYDRACQVERLDARLDYVDSELRLCQAYATTACTNLCRMATQLKETIAEDTLAGSARTQKMAAGCETIASSKDLLEQAEKTREIAQERENRLLQSYYFAQPAAFSC